MTTNCVLSIPEFGRITVRALNVTHGMNIVAYAGEGQSRKGKAFYSSKRTSGSFELSLIFAKYESYHAVCQWLELYSRWMSDPTTPTIPCRVMIPARNFDKTGVLEDGITFGTAVGDVTYTIQLAFIGSRDPIEMNDVTVSNFTLGARRDDPALPYFYPAGTQLKGSTGGLDDLYDRFDVATGNGDQSSAIDIEKVIQRRVGER